MGFIFFFLCWAVTFAFLFRRWWLPPNVRSIQRFHEPLWNELHQWSFVAPFKWFVDDEQRPVKSRNAKIKEKLMETGWDRRLSLRSYMTLKTLVFFGSVILFVGWVCIAKEWHVVERLFGRKDAEPVSLSLQSYLAMATVCLLLVFLPDVWLNQRARTVRKEKIKDLPLLQMFAILMLRANKPIGDVLFALSKLDTPHKEVFGKAFHVYLRNRQEGLSLLVQHFEGTKFAETLYLFQEMNDYSRQEIIRILEEGLASITEEMNQMKQRHDLSRLIYSQASMVVPFAAILLLGALPFIVMSLEIFARSFSGGGM
ncbi:UNVERIFIED_ORG: hypothetical protein BDK47_11836 [Anoxybacillus amylolyticus]